MNEEGLQWMIKSRNKGEKRKQKKEKIQEMRITSQGAAKHEPLQILDCVSLL